MSKRKATRKKSIWYTKVNPAGIIIATIAVLLLAFFFGTPPQKGSILSTSTPACSSYTYIGAWGNGTQVNDGYTPNTQGAYINKTSSNMQLAHWALLPATPGSLSKIQIFTSAGAFIKRIGEAGSGTVPVQFKNPMDMVTDSAGNMYVTDWQNDRVMKLYPDGTFFAQFPVGKPIGITMDASENLYVGDNVAYAVKRLSPITGQVSGSWGSKGTGLGQFNWVGRMAVSGNYLYVSDYNNHKVQKINITSGVAAGQWGTLGTGNGQFNGPIGLDVDGAGYVYVADGANDRIQKFDSNGIYITQFAKGTADRQYRDVAVDGNGRVYAVDYLTGYSTVRMYACSSAATLTPTRTPTRTRTPTPPALSPTKTPTPVPFPTGSGAFLVQNGVVAMEAEHFDQNVSVNGKTWTDESAHVAAAPSGGHYMTALLNTGINNNSGYVITSPTKSTNSPMLAYNISIPDTANTGTYYVWMRNMADSGSDDSLHVGLDGQANATSDRMISALVPGTVFGWSRKTLDTYPATINITTKGLHTINVWMREDGFHFDKIVLKKDSSGATPENIPESPRI